ncbi:glycosyltransferase family 4 protein [Glutamicibacter sp. MNS18]|uniref:glycosyltransferase family 4 protein n=1 Tax=Glutamicibacter sp. MNS18 TaxID=2989817 RepID=UPI002235B862|nr:glycosyltransferase family 4 protein [Glutamicibacter sp. MNS18]MCW4466138.1 glycosyltransferase family 4 protein [Glutamicibacter sp. MNS18]
MNTLHLPGPDQPARGTGKVQKRGNPEAGPRHGNGLRILLLTHSFSPDISPPQRRWRAFTEAFTDAGHDVSVVTPRSTGSLGTTLQHGNGWLRVRRYPSPGRARTSLAKAGKHVLEALLSMPLALRSGPMDVVIATVPALPTLGTGYLASRLLGSLFVVDLRDAWPNLLRESNVLRSSRLEPWLTEVILWLLRRADLVVTVSHGLEEVARAQGIERVLTLRNGVDVGNYQATEPSPPPRNEPLRVLYLGNLGHSQGLEIAIAATAALPRTVQLRIVGAGAQAVTLRDYARDQGVEVDFREPVHGAEVLRLYDWADTCLVSLRPDWPSFEHTIPSKLYELLALDQHVTGLVRGEAAQIIQDAEAGQVVEQTTQALIVHFQRLAGDRELLQRSGSGPRWVREHANLRVLGKRYTQALEELVNRQEHDEP